MLVAPIHEIIYRLTTWLFSHEFVRLAKRELALVTENTKLENAPDGFLYRSVYFSNLDPKIRARGRKGKLHPSMYAAVEAYLKDKTQVGFDRDQIKQALTLTLRDCKTEQDVRDALPEQMVEALSGNRLARTRPEAFTILDNPRAHRQYMKLREKLEVYHVSKLFY